MFAGVEHIGIAVRNLDEAVAVYRDVLGFKLEDIQVLEKRKVKVAFLSSGGQTRIELLEPLSSDSPIAKHLETRGECINHIAVKVDNINAELERLKAKGAVLINEEPVEGAEGSKIAFVHPKSTCGILLELVMRKP